MTKKTIAFIPLLLAVALLGLTGCSRTVEDIAKWKDQGRIEKLIKALSDPKFEVRLAATEALGELQAESAVDSLTALYNDNEEEIIMASVVSLSEIGTPAVITPMTVALTLDDAQARKIGAVTLGELEAVGAVTQLSESLNDSDAEVQMAAAVSLGQIRNEGGSKALVEKLATAPVELRVVCVESLGKTGGSIGVEGLINALADKEIPVRDAAFQSLENLGDFCVPFLLGALQNEQEIIRQGVIKTLQNLDAVPTSGSNLIWYQLALGSIDNKETLNPEIIQTLENAGAEAVDTLLLAATSPIVDFREYATYILEHNEQAVLEKALIASETHAGSAAKKWMAKRGTWAGAPSSQIDLWAAIAALNPDFKDDPAISSSLEMQSRPAFNIIVAPQFKAERPYIPLLIDLLGDTTTPPPEEPDYDEDGIPVVKTQRDMFRGEANRLLAKEKLAEAGHKATLPLIAAIEDDDQLIAGNAAEILGNQNEKRALQPLIHVVSNKLEAGEVLTESPFYTALQKLDAPEAEPLLLRIRPNPDRAMIVFERQYPGVRPISSETKDDSSLQTQPVTFRLGFIDKGRVGELMITFQADANGNWVPNPALPQQLPSM
ncbi:HEAT repeat domain-containing protein [Pontiellaceae bacterium B12219]|nr:HEAT repeat domain-containing protein [Pontiellaceae bacterium B12219]